MTETTQITWKAGDPPPSELYCPNGVVRATLLPRCTAWLCVNDREVTLVDGLTAAGYTPPNLLLAAASLPLEMLTELLQTNKCTLSTATARESPESTAKAIGTTKPFPFDDLGLKASKSKPDYPPAIHGSPIQMFCTLDQFVPMGEEGLVILTVETFVMDGSVLSPPTQEMVKGRPGVVARIDPMLVNPVVGLDQGRFVPLTEIRSMPRPFCKEDGTWGSTELDPCSPAVAKGGPYETTEWSFRTDGAKCSLGYNPVTALVMPRPIGWISTYSKAGRVTHLAPYSFFCDVTWKEPRVAFSGYRKNGEIRKDAQLDVEETGFFCCNIVTQPHAVPMNYSAAELERHESEFELAKLKPIPASTVDAPFVQGACIVYECKYDRTVNVGSFSVVVGKVLAVRFDNRILTEKRVDPGKLQPITRLGYMDEYGIL